MYGLETKTKAKTSASVIFGILERGIYIKKVKHKKKIYKKFRNWNENKQWRNQIEIFLVPVGHRLGHQNVKKYILILIYYVLKKIAHC